ncbi:prepilin-type N-terminal cleavage/methylation domain-containing protein [bacterium]|nr:prepilin-type N-terminal cleavage/methylation domain-containing protein [bacterium]
MVIQKKNLLKGFTLIELLVVVSIIGILSTIGVVAYNGYTNKAYDTVIKNRHKSIHDFIYINLTTECASNNTFTISTSSSLTNNKQSQTKIYCNYTNLWQTVCEVSQSFRSHYFKMYLKNPISGGGALDSGVSKPGTYTIACEAQGSMSFGEWTRKGSPHYIIIISKLTDLTQYKTYIPKKWN